MLFYYVRHGNPIYDPDSLTPLGHRQAEAVARRFAVHGLDRIFVSSSTRAKMTAQPTCEILQIEPVEQDWCNERYTWSEFTVCPTPATRTWLFHYDPTLRLLNSREVRAMGDEWFRHPGFSETKSEQGLKRIRQHTNELFESLGYRWSHQERVFECVAPTEERVALFAHQGFGLAFLSVLMDIPYPEIVSRFDIEHTGVTVIDFQNHGGWCIPKILQFSNDSHLYSAGLPTTYNGGAPV